MEQPYRDNREHLLDCIHLCGLCLLLTREDAQGPLPAVNSHWALVERRAALTGPEAGLTLPALRRVLSLDDCAYFCVTFALCCELDGSLRTQVQALCSAPLPTFDLVLSLYSRCREAPLEVLFQTPDPGASSLRFVFRLEEGYAAPCPLFAGPLLLRRNLLHFLTSGSPAPNSLYEIARFDMEGTLPLHERASASASAFLCDVLAGAPGRRAFFLAGAPGAGKRTLVRRVCAAAGLPVALLDFGHIASRAEDDLTQSSLALVCDLALSGAALCIKNAPCGSASSNAAKLLELLLRPLPSIGFPVFLLCEEEGAAPPLEGFCILSERLDALTPPEYKALWETFRARYPVDGTLSGTIPVYRLNAGRMGETWIRAAHLCHVAGRDILSSRDLSDAVRLLNQPDGYAVPIHTGIRLDDVVVSAETGAKLRLICDFARQEQTVLHDWGFAGRLAYGRGVTALLCGASGTGKTMAASAIANELGLELLRLDLSQVLDKYIGETEKKLAGVFEAAGRGNYVLFFDEADALFSKRTEISSSHDRYANVETSFLLQSIEQYDGIVLLATNLFKNFDEAFLRRINIVARFAMPDEALRLRLWESAFPPETPRTPALDYPLLARELELSPAVIKNAALSAAVMAAADNAAVGMGHLLAGLRGELEKLGQESRLNALEALLPPAN